MAITPVQNSVQTTPLHPVQKNTSRCWQCKKKVGLTPIECRCNYVFCMTHRDPESHNCTFDYKELGKEELREKNPQVIADKISRI